MDVAPILLLAIFARQDPAHIQAQGLAPRVDGRVCRGHASRHGQSNVTQPALAAAAARVMRRGQ